MAKLTLDDLKKIKEKSRSTSKLREGGNRVRVVVHMGTCGIAAGAREVMKAVMDEIESNTLNDVVVLAAGCAGLCSSEPMITMEIAGQTPVKYIDLDAEKTVEIMKEHVINGNVVSKYMIVQGSERTF